MPEPARERVVAAVGSQPAHARDTLDDLSALVSDWDQPAREQLLERFLFHAERGVLLPVATILSVSDLLGRDA